MPRPSSGTRQDLRIAARRDGIDTAYRPLLNSELAHRFLTADPTEQRQLLDTRRAALLADDVRALIDGNADGEDATPADIRAAAVLALAAATPDLIDAAYAAIDHPDQFPELQNTTATGDSPSSGLFALAQIALTSATTSEEAATAYLHAAIATDDPENARFLLDEVAPA